LIELKCDVNIADKNGETALHLAAKNGQHKAAKTLLQHNADHSLVSLSNLPSLYTGNCQF